MDDIVHLKELCSKSNIWMHLSGDNLSGLALAKFKTEVCTVLILMKMRTFINQLFFCFQGTPNLADSITLTPSIWLNISALPVIVSFSKF